MDFRSTEFNKDLKDEIHKIKSSVGGLSQKLQVKVESIIPEFLDGLIFRLSREENTRGLHSDKIIPWDIKEDKTLFNGLLETFDKNFVYLDENENAKNEKGYLKSLLISDRIFNP